MIWLADGLLMVLGLILQESWPDNCHIQVLSSLLNQPHGTCVSCQPYISAVDGHQYVSVFKTSIVGFAVHSHLPMTPHSNQDDSDQPRKAARNFWPKKLESGRGLYSNPKWSADAMLVIKTGDNINLILTWAICSGQPYSAPPVSLKPHGPPSLRLRVNSSPSASMTATQTGDYSRWELGGWIR